VSVRIVVSDTSPIRALAHLELVDLLDALYGEVFIPPAVVFELERRTQRFAPFYVRLYPFLKIVAPTDNGQVSELLAILDPGEAESIVLAEEIRADQLLMDELKGRAEAVRRGLKPMGVLGVLLRAKEQAILTAVIPLLEQLEQAINFFVSPALRAEIRRQSTE
jgi:predicted nucleic acid-binding protein